MQEWTVFNQVWPHSGVVTINSIYIKHCHKSWSEELIPLYSISTNTVLTVRAYHHNCTKCTFMSIHGSLTIQHCTFEPSLVGLPYFAVWNVMYRVERCTHAPGCSGVALFGLFVFVSIWVFHLVPARLIFRVPSLPTFLQFPEKFARMHSRELLEEQ